MITITRRFASQLRSVLRRAFGTRGVNTGVTFIGDKEVLTARSVFGDIAVEYRERGERTPETIWLPFEFLKDVEGKKEDPVELEVTGKDEATVRWQDGSVPQVVKYNLKNIKDGKFPDLPTDFTTNPSRLTQALHEASETADTQSIRFATGCLQLRPDGSIAATDGRQALIESGFTFPWTSPVLIPRSKLFNSPELHDKPVSVAQTGDWVVISVEPWTFYLRIDKEGRFPDMSRIMANPDNAKARCQLSQDDMQFLAETLPKLPCDEEQNFPVTLDVNGHIAIRAKASDQARPTEVVLSNSTSTGESLRININRKYLRRAMQLGVHDLCLFGEDTALLGQGNNTKYVWMPLEAKSAIKPADDALRIESPKGGPVPIQHPAKPRSVSPVSEPTNNPAATNGQIENASPKTSRRKARQQDLAALIDQAVEFRSALHNLVQQSAGLVKALKQHRRQNRAIQNTLESIKQLKTLGV